MSQISIDPGVLSEDDILLLDDLHESKGFKVYLRILEEAINSALPHLKMSISSPAEIATHNELVGFVNGLQKASRVIPVLMQQVDIDRMRAQQKKG